MTIALIMLAAPASALALSGGAAPAAAAGHPTAGSLTTHVTPRNVAFGAPVLVAGRTTPQAAGDTVELQSSSGRGAAWRRLAATRIGRHGGWAVRVHLRESAMVRAVAVVPAVRRARASTAPTARFASPAATGETAVSHPTRVQVRAQLRIAAHAVSMTAGHGAGVAGRLLPARSGRSIAVQARIGRAWRTIGRGRTGGRGGFSVQLRAVPGTGRRLRAVFAGDRHNAGTTRGAGTLTLYTPALASWYNDAGSNACGFFATYGVANKTLPCGTKVHFRLGSHTVTATVDDRGPYVGGREYDLAAATAGALGFAGVGTVQASVGG